MTEQTKQKLKDVLIEHKNIALSEYDDEDAFVGIYFCDLVDIINSVINNTGLNYSNWISVKKELPKEKQKVLVYMPADERCGHEYIILNGMYLGNIIHSESCPCKKGEKDETE